MKKKCFIYIRTAIESKDSIQLRIQLNACLKFAHERGFQVKNVITDFSSGNKTNKTLSAFAEAHIADAETIITFRPDRISRNYKKYIDIVQQLLRKGIRVEFVNKSQFIEDLSI